MNKVIFTKPAEYDLLDIEYYIHVRLCNRDAADRMIDGILEQANSLADFPMKCPFVEDELLRAIGIRVAGFENYYIFYIYDEENGLLSILRILYARSDWKRLLIRQYT